MNKTIIIDLTSLLGSNVLTGIQRTTIEFTTRFIKHYENVILLRYVGGYNKFLIINKECFLRNAYDKDRMHKINKIEGIFKIKKLNQNYVWLDIDSVWDSNCYQRSILYKLIKTMNIKIVSMIYDLLPISHPEFWDFYDVNYLLYFASICEFTDLIICNTNSVKNELNDYFNKLNTSKEIIVVPLGSDLKKDSDNTKVSPYVKDLAKTKFLLIVATIEPRKNHKLLLEAYKRIHLKYNINLVVVGRIGWMCNDIINKIKKSKLYNKRIFLINNANNDEIIYLYKNAYAFIFPSFAEGYGLPIVESLFYKCPVFASNIDVFKEIAQNKAVFFDNKNPNDLFNKLSYYLDHNIKYKDLKLSLNKFNILTWDEAYSKFYAKIQNIINN